ncbi:MAG: endonuclease Q family protein [Candidatus Nanoarchaeia archaeon]
MVEVIQKNWLFADLHIHSRFSRACSKDLTIPNLVKWARIKGMGILGTGDFSHPIWISELKQVLKQESSQKGVYYYEDSKGKFPFILTGEISLIYSQAGKGRKVHLVILVPNFETVDKINAYLDTLGRRDYDGRPIFGVPCPEFIKKLKEINEEIEIIPAHIYTPYFGVFGSKSGFNSLDEAFLDSRKYIHAIETGISSDPKMNWKIKDLENTSIVSFSDSHSYWPWRIGREATIFKLDNNGKISYNEIIRQIRENDFIGTIETDPAYGMYHFDGHKDCDFSCSFEETKKLNGKCPKCHKDLTIGVDNRVEELANQNSNHLKKKMFYSILPLHEIISLASGLGMNSKGVWKIYDELIKEFENELNILINVKKESMEKVIKNSSLIDLILKNREGKIKVKPGYDGKYGEAIVSEKQAKLF